MPIAKPEDSNPEAGEHNYGDVAFADPTNKTYPLDTEEHVCAAWSSIHMPRDADEYSTKDLEAIKNQIRHASESNGMHFEPE